MSDPVPRWNSRLLLSFAFKDRPLGFDETAPQVDETYEGCQLTAQCSVFLYLRLLFGRFRSPDIFWISLAWSLSLYSMLLIYKSANMRSIESLASLPSRRMKQGRAEHNIFQSNKPARAEQLSKTQHSSCLNERSRKQEVRT